MARLIRNAKLDTRTARSRLPMQKAPYWMPMTRGCALGYRKGAKAGMWLARYIRDDARRETRLGPADDALDADGTAALDFAQAQEKARNWFAQVAAEATGNGPAGTNYTVSDAATDYMAWFEAHRKSVKATRDTVDAHILPSLGARKVAELTAKEVREWHVGLANRPARLRTKPGRQQKYRAASADPETLRRRRSTANRVLTVLKAILNHAWQEGRVPGDDGWRRVKPFQGADAARVRTLSKGECARLVMACEGPFARLVKAGLLTGCRYGELTRLSVCDFNADVGTLAVREAKSGHPRHVVLADDGRAFFAEIAKDRPAEAPMLPRVGTERWGRSHQVRPLKEVCERAEINPSVGFHVLRHTYASHLVMNGAPLQVVAHNLGHADTRMVERHYAHLQPSYVASAIRAASPGLVEIRLNGS